MSAELERSVHEAVLGGRVDDGRPCEARSSLNASVQNTRDEERTYGKVMIGSTLRTGDLYGRWWC